MSEKELKFLPVEDPEEIERMEKNDLVLANAYLRGKIDWLSKEKTYSHNPRRKTDEMIDQLKEVLKKVRNQLGYSI